MDYLIKKEKKIVYCILDNIEEFYSTTSQEIARNVSDFFLSLVVSKNYDIIIDKNTDALLERAAQDNFYTHAVVVITGTHTGLSERLLQAIEKKCNEFFTLSGHVLDRGDAYYEIHNQFFIVNLDEYKRLGKPKMGEVSWNEVHEKIEPIRSEECVRGDKEIPVWIKNGFTNKTYKHKRHGWNFFKVGLENNAVFCDVGDEIRNEKNYLYYEYDHVFYRHVPNLFDYQLICNNMVTPWNSDIILENETIEEDALDHYVTTGTGLNWIYNITQLGYHENTKVTFVDNSYAVLNFMKSLIETWDGKDYDIFYMEHLKFVPYGYNLDLEKHKENIKIWFTDFQKRFENFTDVWNTIKKLKFNFVLLDFFANKNLSFIDPKEITFVNVSDVFNHVPYAHIAPVKFRVARENFLITTIKNIGPKIYFHISFRLGFVYKTNLSTEERIRFGRINAFVLWDINEFNTPTWQIKNWKSLCPITGDVRIL